jgi:hypothetical protein
MRKQIAAARAVRRATLIEWLGDYLSRNPCVTCGEGDPRVLDFDHLRDKTDHVGTLIQDGYGLRRIQDEIKKCQVLCANCHRKKTAVDFDWWRTALAARLGLI